MKRTTRLIEIRAKVTSSSDDRELVSPSGVLVDAIVDLVFRVDGDQEDQAWNPGFLFTIDLDPNVAPVEDQLDFAARSEAHDLLVDLYHHDYVAPPSAIDELPIRWTVMAAVAEAFDRAAQPRD